MSKNKIISAGRLGTFQSCQWRSSDIIVDRNDYKEVMECQR
jgi:hypothetical protein